MYCYLLSNGYIFRTEQECNFSSKGTIQVKGKVDEVINGTISTPHTFVNQHNIKNAEVNSKDVVMTWIE